MDLGLTDLIALATGYIAGSVPFGLFVTRMGGAGDVRSIGSGNIGATNVLRTGRKGLAALTLLLDALKGLLPVLWFAQFGENAAALAGLGAFLGHCYPVWLKFQGGKGIATFVGVVLGFGPWLLGVFAVVWLGVAYLTRYSSLAALCATVAVSITALVFFSIPLAAACIAMTVLTYWRHRANISRLRDGSEGKIGAKG
ncbi:MAG: glycerol-3-phosphate 1-O-acyltransferase PlsY [Pseudomonadota bacterium]